ncbi:Metabotropic glutamate receptor 2, partial [Armadillidium vulgare]
IANVLRLFKVPQISYRSTSASLSDRKKFPYFLRTVPSDKKQAEVIINIMEHLNISYASLIYSNNEYGLGGHKDLTDKVKGSPICFASPSHVVQAEDPPQVFQDIVDSVKNRTQTK